MRLVAMAKKVTLKTDHWEMPFSCMHGRDRDTPNCMNLA
jgi:hypothetical protein